MILGLICARGGSKGIPRKNLKELNGLPIILHTYELAKYCKEFDKVIVSTDDLEIASLLNEVQMRPAELATDTASKWDVFRYIAECNPQYDILVDLDTGCPLRAPEDITNCIEKLKTGFDVVVTAYEAERNPYFNMVEVDRDDHAWVCNATDIVNRQQAPKVYSLSPSVFAIRREALFKYSHWSRAMMGICIIPRVRGLDIDTQDDFDYIEYLMAKEAND
jgi:N-acylneuraminate cytidylyltransferase/CMP-N,N'-diacetyllegionaminic acid synthase